MGEDILEEKKIMKKSFKKKCVHQGKYFVEVEVELIEDEYGWSPYLSVEDASKLDDVRSALQKGDLETASQYGIVYELRPVMQM